MASSFTLPLISLDDAIDQDQLAALTKACSEHGFFLLSNAKPDGSNHISPSCIARAWEIAERLFDVDQASKSAVSVRLSTNNRGYFSTSDHAEYNRDPKGITIKDNKEGFFFGSDSLIGPGNVVPAGLEELLPELESYMSDARQACIRVMRAITRTGLLTHLGSAKQDPDGFVSKYLEDPVYMMKALKYPPTDGNTDAHTDYGCITLLLPGDEGLQVWYQGEWHPVPLVPNAFVINFGDMLQLWSGGAIKSTIHRVIYNTTRGKPRYSIPFFLHPQRGSSIYCGPEKGVIDSYSYLLDRFDKTYKHRRSEPAPEPLEDA